jgi:uncharacterized membrane protein YuzA (DUF378 family)
MKLPKGVQILALLLVIVGALNWGLVGIANFDLVYEICDAVAGGEPETVGEAVKAVTEAAEGDSGMYIVQRIVYIVVGVSGLLLLLGLPALLAKKD